MRSKINQAGFEAVGVIVVVLMLAVVGAVGYKVMNANKLATTDQADTTSSVAVPAKISTQADLTQTSKSLDESNTQLDSSMDDTTLDADVNNLL